MKSEIRKRLVALRAVMQKSGIDAWYISGTDPHSSEYLPIRWQTRQFISGFTGSYGMLVVTQKDAALWTDSRYFLQAEEQLEGTGIVMQKLRVPEAVLPEQWILEKLPAESRVGVDTQTISADGFRQFENVLKKGNIALVATGDLFEQIWQNRPDFPANEVFEFELKYTGLSRKEKQEQLITATTKAGANYHLITMLDELAWQFNLRGSDILYNPVFCAYALVGKNKSYLFVNKNKLNDKTLDSLHNDGVEVLDYEQFYDFLSELNGQKIYLDANTANFAAFSNIRLKNEIVEGTSIVSLLKAKKNPVELEGFRTAMLKDGVALVEFLFWLKQTVGKSAVSEYTIGEKLKECRAKQEGFMGESFPPIVGYKEHGAIVHLSVTPNNALPVKADGILLFDSGGQYFDGTTDITRTVALGRISEQQRIDYTLVLKGMMALSMAKFPYGTKGCHLDILARQPLWQNGMNYGHGTGHGVGHFLNVHEGPMAIRQEYNENMIEPGHVLSNEPAFYREGQYGIRTENMIVCKEMEETQYGRFLGFETLTLCPIDLELIKTDLLSFEETQWLNKYHQMVNQKLKPCLAKEYHEFLDELTQQI
ncbi:aminopeptidase P family protein [uncultured Draconibacterium sp.]|uniref:aminopeptidase P family protein n=1 Tax=uncultured Draconibacterium sp. TaxID=1573823 RepID=UPI00325FE12D